jgi:hypothetical protein
MAAHAPAHLADQCRRRARRGQGGRGEEWRGSGSKAPMWRGDGAAGLARRTGWSRPITRRSRNAPARVGRPNATVSDATASGTHTGPRYMADSAHLIVRAAYAGLRALYSAQGYPHEAGPMSLGGCRPEISGISVEPCSDRSSRKAIQPPSRRTIRSRLRTAACRARHWRDPISEFRRLGRWLGAPAPSLAGRSQPFLRTF